MKVIKNKFAGTCQGECGKVVEAGKGAAIKVDDNSPWKLFCLMDMGETHGALNPWNTQARNRSRAAYGNSTWEARAIRSEYQDTDYYLKPCTCGDTMWWKATVGAIICPECGKMEDTSGNTYETESHVWLHTL